MNVTRKLTDEVMTGLGEFGPIVTDGDLGFLKEKIDWITEGELPPRKLEVLFNAVLTRIREGKAA